jgi:hypothetical protein
MQSTLPVAAATMNSEPKLKFLGSLIEASLLNAATLALNPTN